MVLVDGKVSVHAGSDENVLFLVVLVETETVEDLHVDGLLHLLDLAHRTDVLVVLFRLVLLHLPLHVPHVYVPVYTLAHHYEIVVRNHNRLYQTHVFLQRNQQVVVYPLENVDHLVFVRTKVVPLLRIFSNCATSQN